MWRKFPWQSGLTRKTRNLFLSGAQIRILTGTDVDLVSMVAFQMGISALVQFKTAASAAGFNVHCNEAPESLAAVSSKPPHQQLVSTSIVTKRHVW
jgi:hypothetical protein